MTIRPSYAASLEEYAPRRSRLVQIIQLATETLAGIPSTIYGLFGYLLFELALGFGYSLGAGVVTLALMILPLIIRTSQEALESVPDTLREVWRGSWSAASGWKRRRDGKDSSGRHAPALW
ncbi:MAG: ABC transporter permease subunit [Treponema sp.]|nr:ABC transporter permease subunit [Treponema sp.]MDY3754701.1 ABC transporter permease subunit [Treponema sp.]